jgi:hypothetical protein
VARRTSSNSCKMRRLASNSHNRDSQVPPNYRRNRFNHQRHNGSQHPLTPPVPPPWGTLLQESPLGGHSHLLLLQSQSSNALGHHFTVPSPEQEAWAYAPQLRLSRLLRWRN